MKELIPGVFVTQEQLIALESKLGTEKAIFFMDCFYSKKEQLNMTLNGTVGKKSVNSTLLNAIIGMLSFFLQNINEKPSKNIQLIQAIQLIKLQCCIQKKFRHNIFSQKSSLLSLSTSKILFIYICTLLATSFQLQKVFFWAELKVAYCLVEKFIRKQQFYFSLYFLGTNNI